MSAASEGVAAEGFPETQTGILALAAEGQWEPFLRTYVHPCWKEVVMACRAKGVSFDHTDDLFQELMLRLMRRSPFGPQARRELVDDKQFQEFRGNLPAKYLLARRSPMKSAKFRTYLKRTIGNLVLEIVRQNRRQLKTVSQQTPAELLEPWVEESVSQLIDRQWFIEGLEEACRALQAESEAARTKGRQRMFDVLYLTTVNGWSAERIAQQFQVHRSTIAGLLREVRVRLLALLRTTLDVKDGKTLEAMILGNLGELRSVLLRVGQPSAPSRHDR